MSDKIKPLPCPICGAPAELFRNAEYDLGYGCGASPPSCRIPLFDRIETWNALPRLSDALAICHKHREYYRAVAARYRAKGMEQQARGMDYQDNTVERLEAVLLCKLPALEA